MRYNYQLSDRYRNKVTHFQRRMIRKEDSDVRPLFIMQTWISKGAEKDVFT